MASAEDEDLLALRSAAMATMKKSKNGDSGEDDAELEALRKAALMTKRQDRDQRDRHHPKPSPKVGVPFTGTPPFKLAKGSNLIVISTISDEEKDKVEDVLKPCDAGRPVVKPQPAKTDGPKLMRPQDRWLSENSQSPASSPQKTKAQDKFSRYESSSEEESGSGSDSSDDEEVQNNQSEHSSASDEESDTQSDEESDDSDLESFVTKSELSSADSSSSADETPTGSGTEAKLNNVQGDKKTEIIDRPKSESVIAKAIEKGSVPGDGNNVHLNEKSKQLGDGGHNNLNNLKESLGSERKRDSRLTSQQYSSERKRYSDSSRYSERDRSRDLRNSNNDRSRDQKERTNDLERDRSQDRRNRNNDLSRDHSRDARNSNNDLRRRERSRERTSRSQSDRRDNRRISDKQEFDRRDRNSRDQGGDRRDLSRGRDRNRNSNNKPGARESLKDGRSDRLERNKSVNERDKTKGKEDVSAQSSGKVTYEKSGLNDSAKNSELSESSDNDKDNESESSNSTGDEDSDSDGDGRGHRQTFERNTQDIEVERRKRQHLEFEVERQKRREEREKLQKERESRSKRDPKRDEDSNFEKRDLGDRQRENKFDKREKGERSFRERDDRNERKRRSIPDKSWERDNRRQQPRQRGENMFQPRSKSRSRSSSPAIKSLLSIVTKDKSPAKNKPIEPLFAKEEIETLTRNRHSNQSSPIRKQVKPERKAILDVGKSKKEKRAAVKDARELLRQKRKNQDKHKDKTAELAEVRNPQPSVSSPSPERIRVKQKFNRIEPPSGEKVCRPSKRKIKSPDTDEGSPSKKPVEETKPSPTFKITFNEDVAEKPVKKSIHERLGGHKVKKTRDVAEEILVRKPEPRFTSKMAPTKPERIKPVILHEKRDTIQLTTKPLHEKRDMIQLTTKALRDKPESSSNLNAKPQQIVVSAPTENPKPVVVKKHRTLPIVSVTSTEPVTMQKGDSRKIITSNNVTDERRVVQQSDTRTSHDTRHVVKVSASCDSVLEKPVQSTRKIKLVRKPLTLAKSVSDTTS